MAPPNELTLKIIDRAIGVSAVVRAWSSSRVQSNVSLVTTTATASYRVNKIFILLTARVDL